MQMTAFDKPSSINEQPLIFRLAHPGLQSKRIEYLKQIGRLA